MKILLVLLLFTSFESHSSNSREGELLNFKTDYCTYFPEGTPSRPKLWQDCCVSHDLWYWIGGTKNEQDQADLVLKRCVSQKASSFYGNLMYSGVRLGHLSPIKSKYKWSWGWNKKERHFQIVSLEEKAQAKQILIGIDENLYLINKFIKEHLE